MATGRFSTEFLQFTKELEIANAVFIRLYENVCIPTDKEKV